ncbi:MAG: hypothetical protein AAB535_01470 [Patescibacteria group bacterium]
MSEKKQEPYKPKLDTPVNADVFADEIIEAGIKRIKQKTGKSRGEILEEAIKGVEENVSDGVHKEAYEKARKTK